VSKKTSSSREGEEDVVVLSARLLGLARLSTDFGVGSKKKASATLARMTDAFVRVQSVW
jgi:hypothetical protein